MQLISSHNTKYWCISILKNVSNKAPSGSPGLRLKLPSFKNLGSTIVDVKYAREPDIMVDKYAIPAVMASYLGISINLRKSTPSVL